MRRLWFLLPLLLLPLALGLKTCQRQTLSQPSRPAPLPQDPEIQVYFNHNHAAGADYTDPYLERQRPGDDLEAQIVEAIASARIRVDVAVQELRLPRIAQALVERQRAGVPVRVILEHQYRPAISQIPSATVAAMGERDRARYDENLRLIDQNGDGNLTPAEIAQRDAIAILEQAQIPIRDDRADGSKGSGLMHHKFIIIDNQTVVTGSANFTLSDIHGDFAQPESRGNANNLLRIQSSALAQSFTQEFEQLWGQGPGGAKSRFGAQKVPREPQPFHLGRSTITLHFSPTSLQHRRHQKRALTDANHVIRQTLQRATQSIDLALFVFSEQAIADGLLREYTEGVSIRALIDGSFAFRSYSEGLDMLGVTLPERCKVEANNNPWTRALATVGTPTLSPGDLLHHKFALIDNHIVITGSHNWSKAANRSNDETLLVIENSTVAAHFKREFERLYQDARLGIPPELQAKVAAQTQQCQGAVSHGSLLTAP